MKKLYEKYGLADTQVKYVLNIEEAAGHGSVTFHIEESPKVKDQGSRLPRRGGVPAEGTARRSQDQAALDVFLAARLRLFPAGRIRRRPRTAE